MVCVHMRVCVFSSSIVSKYLTALLMLAASIHEKFFDSLYSEMFLDIF